MPIAVGLFERYALGNVSATQLEAETGLAASADPDDPHEPALQRLDPAAPRQPHETRRPAPWRANPPVSDELWARVEEVRRAKTRGGGPKNWDRVDLLGGLLDCVCGRRLRNDGTFADGRHRKLHANPCEAWGRKARLGDETWEAPMLAQVAGIALDDATMASVVAALGSSRQPVAIDRARIDRQIRELALEHAAGAPRRRGLPRAPEGAPRAAGRDRGAHGAEATRPARGRVAARPGESLEEADVPEEKADLLHAIYERIVGRGPRDRAVSGSRRRPTRTDWRWRCPKRLQWRARQDSNLRPSAPEADALSTELQARVATLRRGLQVYQPPGPAQRVELGWTVRHIPMEE